MPAGCSHWTDADAAVVWLLLVVVDEPQTPTEAVTANTLSVTLNYTMYSLTSLSRYCISG